MSFFHIIFPKCIIIFVIIIILDCISEICDFSNKFYKKIENDRVDSYKKKKLKVPVSHKKKFKDIEIQDFQLFIGLLIVMGINKVPDIRMYFSGSKLLSSQGISEVISEDRFYELKKYCTFFDIDRR